MGGERAGDGQRTRGGGPDDQVAEPGNQRLHTGSSGQAALHGPEPCQHGQAGQPQHSVPSPATGTSVPAQTCCGAQGELPQSAAGGRAYARHMPQLCREVHSWQGHCRHPRTAGKRRHLPGGQQEREEGVSPSQQYDANGFVGSSSRGQQDPSDRQDLCSGVCVLPPHTAHSQAGRSPASPGEADPACHSAVCETQAAAQTPSHGCS